MLLTETQQERLQWPLAARAGEGDSHRRCDRVLHGKGRTMARTYRPTPFGRLRDRMITLMLRKGVGPPGLYLLTVPGRKTGISRTTPVAPLEDREGRWLVAPFGAGGRAGDAKPGPHRRDVRRHRADAGGGSPHPQTLPGGASAYRRRLLRCRQGRRAGELQIGRAHV